MSGEADQNVQVEPSREKVIKIYKKFKNGKGQK